jgi:galactose-1-phosphate uridylyltransferase
LKDPKRLKKKETRERLIAKKAEFEALAEELKESYKQTEEVFTKFMAENLLIIIEEAKHDSDSKKMYRKIFSDATEICEKYEPKLFDEQWLYYAYATLLSVGLDAGEEK